MAARDDAIRAVDLYAEETALARIIGVTAELDTMRKVARAQEVTISALQAQLRQLSVSDDARER